MTRRSRSEDGAAGRSFFFGLLFCSGFASLVYEVAWTRVLLSVFGATVYASGTVLTSFMVGLALGSWLASRWGDRLRVSSLRIYAYLELGIGIYAFIFPWILKGITGVYVASFGQLGASFYVFSLIRFGLAFLALVLPATLMGATLPVITRFGVRRLSSLGRDLGRLYAVNTAGAALGTFVTGYVLIEALGIRNTTVVAMVLNLLVCVGALALERRLVPQRAGGEPAAPAPASGGAEAASGAVDRRLVLLVLAISGCCALAYEVLWARLLVYVLGNFVHSFSIMLAAFLTGIALGSAVAGRQADRLGRARAWLAACQVIIGLAALIMLPLFSRLIVARDAFLGSLSHMEAYGSVEAALAAYHDPWWQFTVWKVGVTFLLMVIPTFCMGASFPLANRLYVRDLRGVVRGVGALYAGNTVGSIVGSFTASFLLIPWLGVRDAAVIMAVLNLAGAALLLSRRDGRWRAGSAVPGWGLTLLAGLLALLLIPPTVFHPIYASAEKDKSLIHVDETVAGTVTIHETPGGFRVIDINGLNVAGTKFGFHCTQKLQAHFPLLMHPRPRHVMQIGFGTGGTCWSVSLHPEVERIDCVEINPGVIAAAPHFEEINHGIYKPGKDPRVTVTIEDARNFVLTTPHRYDVILSDSIHPRFTGNGLLYTRDYFEICAQVLEEDGIFSTWLPTAFLGDDEFRMIVRTLQSVFPHVLIWYMNNTVEGYTIAMGSRRPFAVDFDSLAERIARPALREDLATVHLENVYDLLDCIILGGANVVSYLGEGPLNTEDRPLIEFQAPRNMNRVVTEYRNLERLLRFRNFPEAMMGGWSADPDTATARRATFLQYFRATGLLLRGHQAHLMGRFPEEQALYEQALAVNPADRDAVYLTERLERQQHGEMLDY